MVGVIDLVPSEGDNKRLQTVDTLHTYLDNLIDCFDAWVQVRSAASRSIFEKLQKTLHDTTSS